MSTKKQKIVMLDLDVYEKITHANVNVSAIVNNFLANLPVGLSDDDVSAMISIVPYQKEKSQLEEQVVDLDIKSKNIEKRRQEITSRIEIVSGLIDRGTKMMIAVEKSKRIASLFSEMNQVIRQCNYNAELSWDIAQGIVQMLQEAGRKEINKAYFLQHVERLQNIGE